METARERGLREGARAPQPPKSVRPSSVMSGDTTHLFPRGQGDNCEQLQLELQRRRQGRQISLRCGRVRRDAQERPKMRRIAATDGEDSEIRGYLRRAWAGRLKMKHSGCVRREWAGRTRVRHAGMYAEYGHKYSGREGQCRTTSRQTEDLSCESRSLARPAVVIDARQPRGTGKGSIRSQLPL